MNTSSAEMISVEWDIVKLLRWTLLSYELV
jgi:hypothetical protein